ncbi:uncharacterized protein involved in oxidation of intracellular sulfur [Nonomuraea polychroma]|uniref:Uncharacterized protein involved in oxidation of intracellular sulfur n=1 Tax=Nonomuraea polychroma TaxID=46176 RepID=A0A438M1S4_9ACTN|nr:DsrE family protein [Nonomuraea polychroma]RVX39770.1 uncharacterized protein involved in oxidation of intracellular sulfur [Nonomuraea polychroma]
MKVLFVLHDPPYGTERTYNGIRWARTLLDEEENEVKVFLFGDAVVSVMADQRTPNGYYNVGSMIRTLIDRGAEVGSCGTCLDARGIDESRAAKGPHRSSMKELSGWTAWADKVINV